MSSKILLRRGTATQWSSANPILGNGELGIETDTLKIKIGNGTSTWSQLASYANITPSELTSAINSIIDLSPSTLDTLNELAAAINDDPNFFTSVNTSLSGKASLTSANTFTGNNTFASPIVGFVGTSGSYSSAAVSGYNIMHLSQGMILINSQSGGDYNLATNTYYNSGWKYFESSPSTLLNFGNGNFDFNTTASGTAGNAITFTSKMKINNSGNVTINGFGASTVGLIVKAAASQTANLQEWQNSSGNLLTNIAPNGNLVFSANYEWAIKWSGAQILGSDVSGATPYSLIATPYATNYVPLAIKGKASQTANLTEWQGSGGNSYTVIDAYGALYASDTMMVGPKANWSTDRFATGGLTIINRGSASSIPFGVRGTASQTADLQQWQNSSGAVLAKLSAYGDFIIPDARVAIGASSVLANTFIFANTSYASYTPIVVRGAASQTANLQEWQDSTGTALGFFASNGTLKANYVQTTLLRSPTDYQSQFYMGAENGSIRLDTAGASTKGLVIRGAASQTANLQEWQNSAGTVKARIDSNGNFVLESTIAYLGTTSAYVGLGASNGMRAHAGSASVVPWQVIGAASQTANLQEWQNSSGTVLAKIYSSGAAQFQTTQATKLDVGDYANSLAGNYINVKGASASTIGIIVRGAASQTANLQEWQNSNGTVLAYIEAGGHFGVGNLFSSFGGSSTKLGYVTVSGSLPAIIPLVVKGAASQTANLQEWQNSSGTVLAKIDSSGNWQNSIQTNTTLYTQSINSGSLSFAGVSYNGISNPTGVTTLPTLVIKGIASQTANLQEWQNSSATVLASVDKDGYLQTPRLVITNGGNIIDSAGTTPYFGFGSNQIAIYTRNAAYKGLIIQGSASQTANLQEWQDSASTALVTISSTGFINTSSGIGANTTSYMNGISDASATKMSLSFNSTSYGLLLTNIQAAGVGFIVKAAASQTANLQEWQNSAGSMQASVGPSGGLAANYYNSTGGQFLLTYSQDGGNLRLYRSTAAANVPGTNTGVLYFRDGTTAGTLKLVVRAGTSGAESTILDNIDQSVGAANSYLYTTPSASNVGLIIKGAASQSANLQEWQNNSGTVLAKITASGALDATAITVNGAAITSTPTTSDIELMNIMGAY